MDNFILFLYNFTLHSLFLAGLPLAVVALPFVRRFRQGFWNYFGLPFAGQAKFFEDARAAGGRVYLIHGVSVGEIKLAAPVMEEIAARDPQAYFALSTTSPDSFAAASGIGRAGRVIPLYFPLDIPVFVSFFFRSVRPAEIYILEVDLWPNFLIAASCRDIPVFLLNGRISEKTRRFYSRLPAFSRSLFSLIDLCFMQSEEDRAKAVELGADAGRVAVAGNMKFDTAISPAPPARIAGLEDFVSRAFGRTVYETTFCAGSTHADEEEIVFDAAAAVLARRSRPAAEGGRPAALMIVVPRRPERAAAVAEKLGARPAAGRVAIFTGAPGDGGPGRPRGEGAAAGLIDVMVIGAMGYLTAAYSLSDAAFVGGTLSRADVGGHNIIEPAAFAIPVVFGSNVRNFRDAAAALLKSPNVFMVSGARELESALAVLLDPGKKAALEIASRRLLEIISENSNATARIFAAIDSAVRAETK